MFIMYLELIIYKMGSPKCRKNSLSPRSVSDSVLLSEKMPVLRKSSDSHVSDTGIAEANVILIPN